MNWLVKTKEIYGEIEFEDQTELAKFVLKLAKHSDRIKHHADLSIRYNVLKISITTHDTGGLTQKDFNLQSDIERIKKG